MTRPVCRLLLVEDHDGDARLIREELRGAGAGDYELTRAHTLAEALAFLNAEVFDAALVDLSLPDSVGFATPKAIRDAAPTVPIVVLTGLNDDAVARRAVAAGAQDFLVKGDVTGAMISRSIRYAIERHQLLLEIERAKRDELAMKDQFLSNVSHELRGPLTSVHLFAANLHDGLAGPVTEPQRECLEVILRNTSRLKTRIDDLLEATRLQAGKVSFNVQAWPIGTLIEQAVTEMRAQAPQLSWRRELDGGLPDVHADRARIDQVLKNLLDNAEKFTAPGGSVVVRAFAADSPGMVGVEVADSGCGIPSHAQAHVFDRLYQHGSTDDQRSAGLGLGLYICREIVERHGGRLSVRSEVGVGSRFLFTIPAGPESARTRSGTE